MDFLSEVSQNFDYELQEIDVMFIEAVAEYHENVDVMTHLEAAGDPLTIKIKKVFVKMITAISNFLSQVKIEVSAAIQKESYRKNLRKLHKELKEKRLRGIRNVEVQDLWSIRDVYLKSYNQMKKYGKRFEEINRYRSTLDLEKDLAKFESIYEQCEKDLERAFNKTVTIGVDEMIRFIDKETSSNGQVIQTITECKRDIEEMGHEATVLIKQADVLGPDIIEKHVGCIRRMLNKICGFIKKWVVKFIVACCIIIG